MLPCPTQSNQDWKGIVDTGIFLRSDYSLNTLYVQQKRQQPLQKKKIIF